MINLTVTSYLVLGMIRLRGPSTSYELKRAVGKSLGYFWSFPHAQIYREPTRLAAAGLLAENQESGGRNRRTYTITPQGERALHAWLADPVEKIQEFRDLAQLKLFFSELMSTQELVSMAREQIALHRDRLRLYENMQHSYTKVPALAHRAAPLGMGLLLEQASIAFWSTIAENPPMLPPVATEEQENEAMLAYAEGQQSSDS